MKASGDYYRYLSHFGRTVPICDMHRDRGLQGVGLRHDVDYDLDAAVALGHAEAELGCRSTFYLLHSAAYWEEPALGDACRTLGALGHEIGLHLNVLAEWYNGKINEPEARLGEVLQQLRGTGVRVTGCAAHGDPLCYRGNFANHWMLRELRGENPALTEAGMSAEGIRDERSRFQLQYPEDHQLRRPDGKSLALWLVAMSSFGLEYHAVHVPHDRYFSDSGGSWKRTPDPLGATFEGGRWQVLMHPEYWLAPPRILVSFGKAAPGLPEEAAARDYVSVSAERVALAMEEQAAAPRGKRGHVRTALAEVQRLLPPKSDALVYGMPGVLRCLWEGTEGAIQGESEEGEKGERAWLLGDFISLQAWPKASAAEGGGQDRAPVGGLGCGRVAVAVSEKGLVAHFKRRGRWNPIRSEVYVEPAQGSCGGLGNWRVALEVEADGPGTALYVADRIKNNLAPRFLCKMPWRQAPLRRDSAGPYRISGRVSSLPQGKRRITFCYGQMPEDEGFVPVILASREFEGTVRVTGLRVARADDCFFAAEPRVESLQVLES